MNKPKVSQRETFAQRCYNLLKKVPAGKVTTYAEIARALDSRAYRAVGSAMKHNPYAPEVPCHRVVNSNGRIGGFAWGVENKIKLLKSEGIEVKDGKVCDFKQRFFKFKNTY